MTCVVLLEQLKAFTEDVMKDLLLPVAMQKGDTEQEGRPPAVYLMRLPDSKSAQKKAPTSSTASFHWLLNSSQQRGAHGRFCALYFLLL